MDNKDVEYILKRMNEYVIADWGAHFLGQPVPVEPKLYMTNDGIYLY